MSKNNYYEDRYISPEETKEYVIGKFDDASEHPSRYHEFWIDEQIGYSEAGKNSLLDKVGTRLFPKVLNAIIVLKYRTDVINIRVVDGKVVGDCPEEFYLVYRPDKVLACAQRVKGNETYIRIRPDDDCSVDFDITVFVMIQYETGLFSVLYTPETARFTEPFISGNHEELFDFMKSVKRFFHLPSNFRSLPKDTEESEDEE